MQQPNSPHAPARVIPFAAPPPDLVPVAVDEEEAVLAALLLDGPSFPLIAHTLTAGDFYRETHRAIYRAMWELWQRREPIDFLTVKGELDRAGELDMVGGAAHLTVMLSHAPMTPPAHIEHYARVVRHKADRRRLIDFASQAARVAYEDESDDFLQTVSGMLESLKAGAAVDPFSQAAMSPGELLQLAAQPLSFVIPPLVYRPSIVVMYGAPGSLKTAIAYDLLLSVVTGGAWLPAPNKGGGLSGGYSCERFPTMLIDCDMGKELSAERFAEVTRGHGLSEAAARDLGWTHIRGDRLSPPLDLSNGRSAYHLTRALETRGVGAFCIDNLGRIVGDAEENTAGMAKVMGHLRAVVEDTGAPCFLLHHQRKGGTDTNVRKGDSLRGHSSIEAALDLAIHVDRESVDGKFQNNVTMTVTKARRVHSEPFGGLYTRNAPGDEPSFRFLATAPNYNPKSNGAIDAAARKVLEAVGKPMTQGDLVDAVKGHGVTAGEKAIIQRLKAVAYDPVGGWRIAPERGERNALLFHIPRV